MSPTKTNASESSSGLSMRPRKVSTQKQRKAFKFKQRKIPKVLNKVPLCFYGAKMNDFMNGVATIQPPVVSESLAPQAQDTVNLAEDNSQIPVSTRLYPSRHGHGGADPSHVPIPYPDFNAHPLAENDILSFTSTDNPCQSCGRYDPSCHLPPSSSTGSLSVELYQQFLDLNTQYFIPQPIQPYVSNVLSTFPGNSYDIYAEITDSSHLTMTSINDDTTLPFLNSNYDANNRDPHSSYYM